MYAFVFMAIHIDATCCFQELGLDDKGIDIGVVIDGPNNQCTDKLLKLSFSGPNTLLDSKDKFFDNQWVHPYSY